MFQGGLGFTHALINSIGIALITTVLALALSSMAAYAITRLDFPGKTAILAASLAVSIYGVVFWIVESNFPGLAFLSALVVFVLAVQGFILGLLGEYVIEICYDIERFARSDLPAHTALRQHLSAFLADNPCFAELTRQRAISYWACYYRDQHPSQDTYPALVALSILSGARTT